MRDEDESKTNQGRVLLSGASGMLGAALGNALKRRGKRVIRLVRRIPRNPDELAWNPAAITGGTSGSAIGSAIESIAESINRLESLDAVVHLSGANVSARRWSESYKEEITTSRVTTTRALAEALGRLKRPPATLVAASAVGYYGDRGEEILDEDSPAGEGFFPELCVAWEAAAGAAVEAGIRVVHPRFGVVIGPEGGAMARLAPLFRLGLGGRLGSGRQWMSWVSVTDAVGAVLFALGLPEGLEEAGQGEAGLGEAGSMGRGASLAGPVNVVAPAAVTNAEFTRELGRAVRRPAVVAAPAFALRLAFGEMADEALLASTRAVPRRLWEAGYRFRYPTLAEALAAALAG